VTASEPAPAVIRRATAGDADRLAEIDVLSWSSVSTPQVLARAGRRFASREFDPRDVLLLEIQGLAVAPSHQRRGIAGKLLSAAIGEARTRGARRLTLRVLADNEPARRLYEAHGFVVEGTLREEFLIDGRYVDDVRMARLL